MRAVVTGGHLGIETALAERLPSLGIVAINGVGYDRIDLPAMQRLGVGVSNTPDVLTDDVADLAIALMLNVMRALPAVERHVREGRWPGGNAPLARRASGLRYGIVGLGRIGQAIAARLSGFGGHIAYTGPSPKQSPHRYHDALHPIQDSVKFLVMTKQAALTFPALSTARRSWTDPERGDEFLPRSHRVIDTGAYRTLCTQMAGSPFRGPGSGA